MKKLINNPSDFVDETIAGILVAHPTQLRAVTDDKRAIVRYDAPIYRKVAIATGGGSGHLPLFLGYVGKGLVDGVAVGNVFSSPSPSQILAVTNSINSGQGVLYLYGNYQGDILSFSMAAELAKLEGIQVETILVSDDLASANRSKWNSRRGIAGLFFAYKISGALAEQGEDLLRIKTVTSQALASTCSIGVALSPGIIPESGRAGFSLKPGEIEIGVGIHGERGIQRKNLLSADEVADLLMAAILDDLPFKPGDDVAVLINSLGSTPKEELFIVYRRVNQILQNKDISIHRLYTGKYATSLEMAGLSISLLKLNKELKALLDAPAQTPFFSHV